MERKKLDGGQLLLTVSDIIVRFICELAFTELIFCYEIYCYVEKLLPWIDVATDDEMFSRHSEVAADDEILIRSQQVAQCQSSGSHRTELHHATYSRNRIQSKTL
jgi:hypothetical protein